MAVEQIGIYRTGQEVIPSVLVDVVVAENHTAENEITNLPLENGSIVTDHVIVQPDEVEITAEVSNYDGPGLSLVGERAKTAWQQLKQLRKERELLTITTQHEIYTNMVIKSISAEHLVPFTGRVLLTAKFQKVNITSLFGDEVVESDLASSFFDYKGFGPDVAKAGSDVKDKGKIEAKNKDNEPSLVQKIEEFYKNTFPRLEELALEFVVGGASFIGSQLIGSFVEILPFTDDGSAEYLTTLSKGYLREFGFKSYYNYKEKSWYADFNFPESEEAVKGIALKPGFNVAEAYPNLLDGLGAVYVIDFAGDGLSEPNSLGSTPDAGGVVIVLPADIDRQFNEAYNKAVSRPFHYDLRELGYLIGSGEVSAILDNQNRNVLDNQNEVIIGQ